MMIRVGCLWVLGLAALQGQVSYSFGEFGLSEISYGGVDYNGGTLSNLLCPAATFEDSMGVQTGRYTDSSGATRTTNSSPDWVQHVNRDGLDDEYSCRLTFSASGNVLQITITLTNGDDADDIVDATLYPFGIQTEDVPPQSALFPNVGYAVGDYGWTPVALLNDTNASIGWWMESGTPATLTDSWASTSTTLFNPTLAPKTDSLGEYDDDELDPIAPGQSKSWVIRIVFGAAGLDSEALAPEAFADFRAARPFIVKRANRRPIATDFLSSTGHRSATNPRGWFQDSELDVSNQSAFNSALAARTAATIALMDAAAVRPQGIIFWDIEGQEASHAISYLGDPENLAAYAPEMDDPGAADAMFASFRAAGYEVGITLRPQTLTVSDGAPATCFRDDHATANIAINYSEILVDYTEAYGSADKYRYCSATDTWSQLTGSGLAWNQQWPRTRSAMLDLLRSKINYARARWGTSIYYIDTNVWRESGVILSTWLRTLQEEYPDYLFLPEWDSYRDACCGAGWVNAGAEGSVSYATYTDPNLHWQYPAGFRAISLGTRTAQDLTDNHDTLVGGIRRGDVYLLRSWYSSPELQAMPAKYLEALEDNGVVTLSTGERYETTIPLVERNRGSCHPNHLAVRFGSTEALNGCNIFTEQGCDETELCRSMDSPCTISDKTAYRLEAHNALQKACSAGGAQ